MVLSTENHTGDHHGREDHASRKNIFIQWFINSYIFHLNPEVDALFKRSRFNKDEKEKKRKSLVSKKVLDHNTLENIFKNMTQRAGISRISESCKSLRLLPFPRLLTVKTVKQAWRKAVAKILLSRERDLSKKVGLS